jgi:RNase P subunit RPR2
MSQTIWDGRLAREDGVLRAQCADCGTRHRVPSKAQAGAVLGLLGWSDYRDGKWRCATCGVKPKEVRP